MLRSRVPGECSERSYASATRHRSRACPRSSVDGASRVNPTCAEPAQKARSALFLGAIRCVAPGSRLSLAGARSAGTREQRERFAKSHAGARAKARRAKRTVAAVSSHDVKQRSLLRSRGAFLRPGGVLVIASAPIEGRAERRQAHLFCCRAGEARPIRTQRGAARPMTRDARLSARHRGDFRPGAALPSPALPPDPCSELLAARSSCLAGGVPDLPSPRLRAAAAGRHSPLRLQDRL